MMMSLSAASPHLGDKAMLPFLASLAEAGIGAGVELVPKGARLRQFREFRAVASLRRFLPRGDGAVLLDLFQPAEHRLVGEIKKLFAAEIVVAPFHVADAQLAIPFGKQCPLQRGDIFEEELLLQVLGTGGDDDSFSRAHHGQQISQRFAGARARLDDQVALFF